MKDCSLGRALRPGFFAAAALALLMLLPAAASAQNPSVRDAVSTFEYTQNMHPMGYSPFANTPNLPGQTFTANSDLAFQGKYAFQGHYIGFRIIDISAPANPREVSFTDCNGNQGDLVVYGDILVRSWNSPAPAGATCDGQSVPTGFEGLHIFDISNVRDPELVGSVEISARAGADAVGCGSHMVTAVPDPANDRLVIDNQSGGSCLSGPHRYTSSKIPLDDPSNPTTPEPVVLTGTTAFPGKRLPRLERHPRRCEPLRLRERRQRQRVRHRRERVPGRLPDRPGSALHRQRARRRAARHERQLALGGVHVGRRGPVLGWEPGGGSAPECEATDPDVDKSWFFYDAQTGAKLGQFVLPRPQTAAENCTIHNYNIVPTDKRYLLVGGNYQAGISVVDFTDPANATEVAYADPAPLVPTQLGGDWSTYYYNGFIYESDITRGLIVWNLSGKWDAGARKLDFLNPQTSMFTLG